VPETIDHTSGAKCFVGNTNTNFLSVKKDHIGYSIILIHGPLG